MSDYQTLDQIPVSRNNHASRLAKRGKPATGSVVRETIRINILTICAGDQVARDVADFEQSEQITRREACPSKSKTILSLNGMTDVDLSTGSDVIFNLLADLDVSIGRRVTNDDRYFSGSIDEVRIYDRFLSNGEIAGLTGLTEPFDD